MPAEDHAAETLLAGGVEPRAPLDPLAGVGAGKREEIEVADEVGDAERREPRLPRAEELARTADPKVELGDAEAVVGRGERLHAGERSETWVAPESRVF